MDETTRRLKMLEIDELRKRCGILEADRKAYTDLTAWQISQNEEMLISMKKENKQLRSRVATSMRDGIDAGRKTHHSANFEMQKRAQMRFELRNRLNELTATVSEYHERLSMLQERTDEMDMEAKKHDEQIVEWKKSIHTIQDRIRKVMTKTGEAQGIGKKYESILQKLKWERLSFNERITMMEKAVKTMDNDQRMMSSMIIDAQHAREVTKTELLKLQATLEKDKKNRELILAERKQVVKTRSEAQPKSAAQDGARRGSGQTPASPPAVDLPPEMIAKFKTATKRLVQEKGISDFNELMQKLITQGEAYESLQELKATSQKKAEKLVEDKLYWKTKFEELRYTMADTQGNRKLMDLAETKTSAANARCDSWRQKYESASKLLISVRGGIEQLCDIVDSMLATNIHDDNLLEVLNMYETKLVGKMTEIEEEKQRLLEIGAETNESLDLKMTMYLEQAQSFNLRVAPHVEPIFDSSSSDEETGTVAHESDEEWAPVKNRASMKPLLPENSAATLVIAPRASRRRSVVEPLRGVPPIEALTALRRDPKHAPDKRGRPRALLTQSLHTPQSPHTPHVLHSPHAVHTPHGLHSPHTVPLRSPHTHH